MNGSFSAAITLYDKEQRDHPPLKKQKEKKCCFYAIAALGLFCFIANLLPFLGQVVVGFFKYVMLPIIIIVTLCVCFSH